MKLAIYVSTTVLTTFLHSICCFLPLLTALMGMGGFSTSLGWLMQYQIYFLVLQVVLLGWAFYRNYRQPHGSLVHVLRERQLLWFVAGISLLAATLPHSGLLKTEQQQLATQQLQRIMNTRQLAFVVNDADYSEVQLRHTLSQIEGVVDSQIVVQNHVVSLRFNHTQTSKLLILNSIKKEGFDISEKPTATLSLK
ncbi:MAG: hypothetical protein U0Y10_22930 [Spirosomataceae bacterium]